MTSKTGTSGSDSLLGTAGANTLRGLAGGDVLSGLAGKDLLYGGDGGDFLYGGSGNDTLNGGAGIDEAGYYAAAAAVQVDLSRGTASGGDGNDTLTGIENVHGSAYNDRLTGDAGANFLYGDGGDDTISGLGGDDRIAGSFGNDRLDGGAGTDTADYSGATALVAVDLRLGTATGAYGTDALANFENVVAGDFGADLIGNSGANRLTGGLGNDHLLGLGGNDDLIGGVGADILNGGDGADTINAGPSDGSSGHDLMTGGLGNDTFIFDRVSSAVASAAPSQEITDFVAGTDKIDLHAIDASSDGDGQQSFKFVGTRALGGVGELNVHYEGGHTVIEANVSGSLAAEMRIALVGIHVLSASDFLL